MLSQQKLLKVLNISLTDLRVITEKLAITPKLGGDRNNEPIYCDFDFFRIAIKLEKQTEAIIQNQLNNSLSQLKESNTILSSQDLQSFLRINFLEFQECQSFTWHNFLFESIYNIGNQQYWQIKNQPLNLSSYSVAKTQSIC